MGGKALSMGFIWAISLGWLAQGTAAGSEQQKVSGQPEVRTAPEFKPRGETMPVVMDAEAWATDDNEVEICNDDIQVVEGEKSLKIKIGHSKRTNTNNPAATMRITPSGGVDLSKYKTINLWICVASSDPGIDKGRFVIVFIQKGFQGQQFISGADTDYVPVNKWVHKSIDISALRRDCITQITPHFYFLGKSLPSDTVMTWYFDNIVFK